LGSAGIASGRSRIAGRSLASGKPAGRRDTIMTHDPVADMLTRLRNAGMARHEKVELPSSRLKERVLAVLKEEGYIRDYEVTSDKPYPKLKVYLKYGPGRTRAIKGIRQISKPGLRVYAQKDEIPRVLGGLGIAVVSTSKGIMTDKSARSLGLGGEVICYVW
jgi:small subunit ribosomal protein S8